jgi:hypothetical protein
MRIIFVTFENSVILWDNLKADVRNNNPGFFERVFEYDMNYGCKTNHSNSI